MTEEALYPCDNCGELRTRAEGGTVFTLCEVCWDKHYVLNRAQLELAARGVTTHTSTGASVKRGALTIPIAPVAKARARTVSNNGKVNSFTPKKTKDYEETLRQWMAISGLQIILRPTPISLKVTFYIQQPRRCKWDYPITRPDIDNYVKAIFDAGNGILWEDDSQIVELHARKVYTNKEGFIELQVERVK